MDKCFDDFLFLIRLGIGCSTFIPSNSFNWTKIKNLADKQGLTAILVDGVENIPVAFRPKQELLLEWIGETLEGYEYRYYQYTKAISELAGFYNAHGYKMMVLKGYVCSLDWPIPSHRPSGDIDIWLFGDYIEADKCLKKEKNIEIDYTRQHHTVFYWNDFMVENHFDFLDVHHHKSNAGLEKNFKKMGHEDSQYMEVMGERIYGPSTNMHALFLLKHAMSHFAAEGITIRHILDWGFYVKAHTKEIDWKWLMGVLDEYGMTPAFNIFNAICVEDLGFESHYFPLIQFDPFLKDKVLQEILSPSFSRFMPKSIFPRVFYKIRRWNGNAWKHELCYKDSMWSAFWSGAWNHLMKPSSI